MNRSADDDSQASKLQRMDEGPASPDILNISPIEHISSRTTSSSPATRHNQAQKIMNLPPDIFLELASFTSPQALLSLAFTCMTFYVFLSGPSPVSDMVWAKVGRAVRMPECPPDLTQIQYMRLVFLSVCMNCGNPRNTLNLRERRRMNRYRSPRCVYCCYERE
ncbi:hypothetical protein DFH11DRAFT_784604 [Phellopilus nigrolimitatus]|nr:hypothetical protein DFH11DRAFT_784604 [Phellopilus nigrolimitatus]